MLPTITATDVQKSFGKYRVIDKLSLTVEPGSVYGLVGLNGAGKTTLLRLLLGILKPDDGTISISGKTPWKHASEFYRNCGVVLENDGFWGNLTIRENCTVYASAKGISKKELGCYIDEFWKETILFEGDKKVKTLSRGQRMQCALCRAFMGTPSVLFLDEPIIALDLNACNHFKKLVQLARLRGASVIISSHQFDTIDELCDRVGILRDGTILEINRESTDTTMWFIDTDNSAAAMEIISRAGCQNVSFSRGVHFSCKNADTMVPVIIKELVNNGFNIREARRKENAFSAAIQMFYSGSEASKL